MEVKYISCSVPQGSLLGPTLWNVYFDSIVNTKLPTNPEILCYADDTDLMVTSRMHREIQRKYLELAISKTEMIISYGGRMLKDLP